MKETQKSETKKEYKLTDPDLKKLRDVIEKQSKTTAL